MIIPTMPIKIFKTRSSRKRKWNHFLGYGDVALDILKRDIEKGHLEWKAKHPELHFAARGMGSLDFRRAHA